MIDNEEKLEKIPFEVIELIKNNSDPQYRPNIDKNKPLEEQKFMVRHDLDGENDWRTQVNLKNMRNVFNEFAVLVLFALCVPQTVYGRKAGYLMVYFKEHGHNVYFAVSRNGATQNGRPARHPRYVR